MVDANESNSFKDLSQDLTTMLVGNVLKKHGFKKDNVKPISAEQKAQLKGLVENLKKQLDDLAKPVETLFDSADSKKTTGTQPRRKR